MARGSPLRVRKRKFVRRGPKAIPPPNKAGRKRSEKRNQADAWLDQYPIFRRVGFQIGPRNNNHPLYEVYCQHMYDNTTFGTEFPSYECKTFRKKLADVSRNARTDSKIVRPTRSHVTGKKRAYGTWHGARHSERVMNADFFSDERIEGRRTGSSMYNASDHGAIVKLLRSDWQKEQRKEMCGAFVLPNGERNQDFCGSLMNSELDELGGRSAVDYATNVSGVYVWYSSQDTASGIESESTRFVTHGQKDLGTHFHNAVLMWNPQGHEFENNTCPYNERFDRGLVALTSGDCKILGIEFLLLVDDDLTNREARNIEKMCQYEINHLPLGSRLHRTPGAGISLDGDEDADVVARRTIGITYLPPNFFELNPDICVVASAY